ncbi:putative transporter [Cryomyces antarcticus]
MDTSTASSDLEAEWQGNGPAVDDKEPTVVRSILKAHDGGRPACFSSTFTEVLFVLTATMAIAMSSFTAGSTTVITSFIGRDLGMSIAEITWISSSSALASGAFLLFFGRIADLFGRRSLFIGSLGLFAVFSLAAGFSRTPIALDVLNGVMGLMSASAVPPAVGMLGVIYEKPSKRKNAAFACFSAGNPLGFIFGTIFSGVATQLFNWRASFWLLAIIYLVFTILAFFTMPVDDTDKQKFDWEAVKRFDILGTVLTVAGIGMFSAALSIGDNAPHGWKTSYVLAMLIIGILMMIGFVFWEHFFNYPLMPLGIWKDRDFSLVLTVLLLGSMSFSSAAFWIALYFQNIWHLSALQAAVYLLPMAIMGIAVNIVAGLILHKVSNKLLMGIGACAYTLSFLLLALNKSNSSYWAFCFPALLLCVVGADLEFNVANMYVMSSMPRSQQSVAGGIFQTVAKLCVTLGFGISTAIFNAVAAKPPSPSGYHAADPATQPYAAAFWFTVAASAASVCLVPWLRIGTQGCGNVGAEGGNVESAQPQGAQPQGAQPPDAHPPSARLPTDEKDRGSGGASASQEA